ncbi:hypothetical protein [Marilutibacter chinensis]|uniref:Uncharacterized protein n=1 Tax=Marilutibacter chinensis TaxID=2912247 RepID=A0ABS9HU95_9GAMM|nr:hypothetical protein [Lysobacter chinensis]MCF7221662.1 hypothetical protein [Lysobacter chinensis]
MSPRGAMLRDRWAAVPPALLMFSAVACSASLSDKPQPEYRESANPQHAYRPTMRIDDALGPFRIMVGAAQYDVVNRECLPPPKENPGGRSSPVPTYDIPFELAEVFDGLCTGVVYRDGMVDEDCHGRGVCRWDPAQVRLKATGAEDETKFIASLSGEELQSGASTTVHYWKGGYPASKIENYPDHGGSSAEGYKPEMRGQLFTITLAPEEAAS